MKSILIAIYSAVLAVVALCVPVFAANPATGDNRGQMMGIVIGVGAVALIAVIIMAALGGKKKKKK